MSNFINNPVNHREIDSCGFGLLVDLNNKKSSRLIKTALNGLARLSHRGAVGEDGLLGDGCGIMIQIDHAFFSSVAKAASISVKEPFAIGMCFLNHQRADENRSVLEQVLTLQGFQVAGWREVPVDLNYASKDNDHVIPLVSQVFIEFPNEWSSDIVKKKLYVAKLLAISALKEDKLFSICSLSTETIVYKALVITNNLPLFYPDLHDDRLQSAVALFHQRFSTNTLSSWHLSQPFSTLAHNGEINTIQGNRHYAEQLSDLLINDYFPELRDLNSLVSQHGSDSLSMDNLLDGIIHSGFSCPEALRLMLPPSWENNMQVSQEESSYYRYHALHLPGWEGPAGIVFFDGRYAGCILDRNGFRPARIVQTKENWIGIGSEIGIFDVHDQEVIKLSRMKPGELLVIDLEQNKVLNPTKFMDSLYQNNPYRSWIDKRAISIDAEETKRLIENYTSLSNETYKRFDVSYEEKNQVLRFMSEKGVEPTFSMGDDTPMASLSLKPRQLFDFFRQQFAQVTNPPIDSLREKIVISSKTYLGTRGLITQRNADFASQIELPSPLLTYFQLNELSSLKNNRYTVTPISLTYSSTMTLKKALDALCKHVIDGLSQSHHFIILSDEQYNEKQCSIHPLLAVGAIHHELIKAHRRDRVSLIINSGWVRDAHHLAMLIASGADAVYPWLAYALIIEMALNNGDEPLEALMNYRQALNKGLLKICSKMGVCTINSYRGSQLFNIIGLDQEIVSYCFSQSSFWLEKYNWQTLDTQQRAFYLSSIDTRKEPRMGGLYKFNYQSEYHDYNPDVVTSLLKAVNEGDPRYYQQFKELVNSRQPVMIRDFFTFKSNKDPIDISRVEAVSSIIKRFDIAAMSLGAISPEAHEALAIAMNTMGSRSNSGEGGEAKHRQGQLTQSKIKQVASGRFGVTAEYLMHAEVIQIKIAQGAKPGEGGQLPGDKVNKMIAELRFCSPGVSLISPPPHHDIYSIEDLAQLIFDLKQVNPTALISVKLVSSPGVGTIAAGVVKAYADMITISGYDGGTGASPLSSIRYAGCPWELGLIEAQKILIGNNLRHRVTIQIDGGLKTGLDVVKAAILGAESYGFGTAPMITLGCKYLRICHLNNCATGIATQDGQLRDKMYIGRPERVILYFNWVAEEVRELLAMLGYTHLKDIIGRTDLLAPLENCMGLDKLLRHPMPDEEYQKKLYLQKPNKPFDKAELATRLLKEVMTALLEQQPFEGQYLIANNNRSIGANIAGEIAKRYGNQGFSSTIKLNFKGIAGQSFGNWLVHGMSLTLEGAANDYVGKSMGGGEIVIKPFPNEQLNPQETCLAGNTCLYGATGGLCFINGVAGERFAVRNSGSVAVVLGIGDHGCEYMTSGAVVVLSTPGKNFAAGMTGGMAFVYDDKGSIQANCNQESVTLHNMNHPDLIEYQQKLIQLLTDFCKKTQSSFTQKLLQNIHLHWAKFYLVLPQDKSPYDNQIAKEPL